MKNPKTKKKKQIPNNNSNRYTIIEQHVCVSQKYCQRKTRAKETTKISRNVTKKTSNYLHITNFTKKSLRPPFKLIVVNSKTHSYFRSLSSSEYILYFIFIFLFHHLLSQLVNRNRSNCCCLVMWCASVTQTHIQRQTHKRAYMGVCMQRSKQHI